MLVIALVLKGVSREDAARTCRMDRQTLRDWVHRFNDKGLAGLSNDKTKGGPRSRLTAEQKAELAEVVRKEPDVKVHGVIRWCRIDLQAVIRDRFGVELAERTIGTILHDLGFRRLSPRPTHPKKDNLKNGSWPDAPGFRRRKMPVDYGDAAVRSLLDLSPIG